MRANRSALPQVATVGTRRTVAPGPAALCLPTEPKGCGRVLMTGDSTDARMEPNASGSPHPDQERQVMAAWDRFLRGTELPANAVRSVIESSWSRCLSARVDPERSRAQ